MTRGKLKFGQCSNGTYNGVYFKISRKNEAAYFEKDFEHVEAALGLLLNLNYITTKKYQIIKDDIVVFRRLMNQPKTLTDGSIR